MVFAWTQSVTLYQLRVFLVVAQHRNYTRAPQQLYLSQPSVSAQVHELERLIGLPLLERVGKRLVLTQAGHLLVEYAQKILEDIEGTANALARFQQVETGLLLLEASTTVGTYQLPKVLGTFHARYPNVELVLALKNSGEVCEDVRQGRVEMGVIESSVEDAGADLLPTPYHDDELLLIVPSWHPWAGLVEVPVAALTQATLLWSEPGSGTRIVTETVLREAGIRPSVTMQIGSTEAIKLAVAANVGVAIVSRIAVAAEVAAGWLVTVRLENISVRRTFHIVRRRSGYLSPVTEAFLRLLTEEDARPGAGGMSSKSEKGDKKKLLLGDE